MRLERLMVESPWMIWLGAGIGVFLIITATILATYALIYYWTRWKQQTTIKLAPKSPLSKTNSTRFDTILPTSLSWKTCFGIVALYVGWLIAITVFFYLFVKAPIPNGIPRENMGQFFTHLLFGASDSGHYREIAKHGYNNPRDGLTSLAFFPLYPFLLFIVKHLLPSYELTAVIFNIIVTTAIIKNLYQLASKKFSPTIAATTIALFLAFPVSFFLFIPQTEALFVLLSLLTFIKLEQQRFLSACGLGFLVALVRPHGFLVCIPLWLWAIGRGCNRQHRNWRALLLDLVAANSPLLGLGIYFLLNHFISGHWYTFLDFQNHIWGNHFQNIIFTIINNIYLSQRNITFLAGKYGSALFFFCLSCLVIIYGVKHKFSPYYLAYIFTHLFLSFSVSNNGSANRFMFVIWPLYIIQAHFLIKHRNLAIVYLLICFTLLPLMYYFFCFYRGYVTV